MKPTYFRLFIVFYIIETLFSNRGELVTKLDFSGLYDWLFTFKDFILVFSGMLLFFGYTLGAYVILFKTWKEKSRWLTVGLITALIPIIITLRYLVQEVLFDRLFGFTNYYYDPTFKEYFADNIVFAIIYLALGSVFFFVQYSKYTEIQQRELLLENKETELSLLRSQLNPHFLFNTLNNLYTLIYQKSDNALVAVEKLSNLLRYSLYETNKKVPLEKEITYLKDFIDLESLRYAKPPYVQLETKDLSHLIEIPPFIFIAFVENAFKHGDVQNEKFPLQIQFKITNNTLYFYSKNAKKNQQKDSIGGIGLTNTRKRLELIYGTHYELTINDLSDRFEVQLTLNTTK